MDRELLARFPVLHRFLALRTVSAIVGGAAVCTQALLIARLLTAPSWTLLWPAAGVVVVRVGLVWWDRWAAETTAGRWKRELRAGALAAVRARGVRGDPGGAVATLVTKGLDAVDGYVTGPLAALPDAAVTPLMVLGFLFVLDWPSGVVVLATLPIVPLLLALVGVYTRARTARQLEVLLRLGSQFLEAVTGLVTLRVLGRHTRTAQQVREVASQHRAATVRTLRLAFLSSFVLETITSLAVAVIAVPVGFRLLDGTMTLVTGLAVLVLTPEAYRPLRVLGAQFHAAEDARAVLTSLALSPPPAPARIGVRAPAPDPGLSPVELRGLAVGFSVPVLSGVTLRLEPGRRYAVVGPSGAGKTTLLRTVAGVLPQLRGAITVGGKDLRGIDATSWNRRLGVVPQRPHLFAGSVADNVRIGLPDADSTQIWQALDRAGAAGFVRRLPGGLDADVGERGARLSAGERQRLALARALVREPGLLLLDEPTARLDGETEQCVLDAIEGLAATVLVVTHRPRVIERVDAVVRVAEGRAVLAERSATW